MRSLPSMATHGGRKTRRSASWAIVVPLLLITCLGMLYAIHWVVRSARP